MRRFDIRFDDNVGAVRRVIERAVRSASERDYNLIAGIFPPFMPEQAREIQLHVHVDYALQRKPETVGVATHDRGPAPVLHCLAPHDDSQLAVSMNDLCASVAALVVQFLGDSTLSWSSKSCLGQALCLSIARDLYPAAVKVFGAAEDSWLDVMPLSDYVNQPADHARNSSANGCVMLFFSFLRQMGFAWHQIVLAGLPFDSTPREIYHILTGDASDPFPTFRQTILAELRR
jgi:hypothetical protein